MQYTSFDQELHIDNTTALSYDHYTSLNQVMDNPPAYSHYTSFEVDQGLLGR